MSYYLLSGDIAIHKTNGKMRVTRVIRDESGRFYHNGQPVCGARYSDTELPYGVSYCDRKPQYGRVRCKKHDRATPDPIQSLTSAKKDLIATALPARLKDRYEQSLNDPDILEQTESLALLRVRIADLLGRVDTGESGKAWTEALKAFQEFQVALQSQDVAGTNRAIARMEQILKRGGQDTWAWQEVYQVMELQRKIKSDENNLLVRKGAMITIEEQMSIIYYTLGVITKHVKDAGTLQAIKADMEKMLDKQASTGQVKVITGQ